jgi:Haem-binding domain
MNKGRVRWTLIILAILLISIQLVRPTRTNPAVVPWRRLQSHLAVPGQVQSVLQRSCYNCHSSETVWPWYSYVAPISWLIADDVNTARSHINFQDWEAQVSPSEGLEHLGLICKEIRDGSMPPRGYRIMHKDAYLSPEQVSAVCAWSETFATPDDRDKKAD